MDGNKPHGNSNDNDALHHLYEIWDDQDVETFKYGVSHDLIEDDNLSKRLRKQLVILNLAAGFVRYIGRILVRGIRGKKEAKRLEDQYTDAFEAKHGRMPRGNLKRNTKKRGDE